MQKFTLSNFFVTYMYQIHCIHVKKCSPRRALVYKGFSKNVGLDETNHTKEIRAFRLEKSLCLIILLQGSEKSAGALFFRAYPILFVVRSLVNDFFFFWHRHLTDTRCRLLIIYTLVDYKQLRYLGKKRKYKKINQKSQFKQKIITVLQL